jgi:Ca2+-transporting ATPase
VVISEFILLLAVRSYFSIPIFTNKWLWTGVAVSLVLQAILIYVPGIRDIFELEMLGVREWIAIGIALGAVAILSFITKTIIKKKVKMQN